MIQRKPLPSLTEGPIARTLFVFSLPVLMGNVLQSLNGSVNAVWVGHYLGEAALSATSSANMILFFMIGSVFGIGMAATILVGQAVGANDFEQAKRVVGTSLSFSAILAIVVAVLGFAFSAPMMGLMHTPADALPLAIAYMRIIFLAIPFLFLFTFVMMALRGAGDSRTPFKFLVLSVVLDIALNPLFIFGWGPVPRLGIAGSAVATLIAQIVSFAALLVYLYATRHFLRLRAGEMHYLRIDGTILRALITKGLPMGVQMIVLSLSMIVMIALVNRYGSQTSAAYGACLQLWNYVQMPAMAVGSAVSAMAAQNVGAGRWDRVHRIALTGVLYNFLMTGALVALLVTFSRATLGLFLPEHVEALDIADHINLVATWSFIFFGVTFVLSGVMRSTGAVIAPLVIMFIALWLIRIPFALLLLDRWQADAIWWSFPVGLLTSMLMSMAYYRYGGWQMARMLKPAAVPQVRPAES